MGVGGQRQTKIFIYLFIPGFLDKILTMFCEAWGSMEPCLVNTGLTLQNTMVNIRTVPYI
jgi:hypothetical protein